MVMKRLLTGTVTLLVLAVISAWLLALSGTTSKEDVMLSHLLEAVFWFIVNVTIWSYINKPQKMSSDVQFRTGRVDGSD